MRGSRIFHERGSNENGNFWSPTRGGGGGGWGGGGPTPQKSRNYLFLGKIFKFQRGSGPPVPPSGSAHEVDVWVIVQISFSHNYPVKKFSLTICAGHRQKTCLVMR